MADVHVFALQGFVCDRYSSRAMVGAGLLGRRFADRLKKPLTCKGEVSEHRNIAWQECLTVAAPYLRDLRDTFDAELKNKHVPVIAANRCGAAIATMGGALYHRPDAVLVWFDAHGDYHIPHSTQTGYLGGMPIAALCGRWDSGYGAPLSPDRVVLAGCRDIDVPERFLLASDDVALFMGSNDQLDVEALVAAIAGRPVWLHVDCDVLDPAIIHTEYRVSGGLSFETLSRAVARIAATSEIVALEVTEFDASDDPKTQQELLDAVMNVFEPVFEKLDTHMS